MAVARAVGSLGGTRNPVSPSRINSAFPPTLVATTGFPATMDSRIVFDIPSFNEDMTETSHAARSRGMSRRAPAKITRPVSPSVWASCRN